MRGRSGAIGHSPECVRGGSPGWLPAQPRRRWSLPFVGLLLLALLAIPAVRPAVAQSDSSQSENGEAQDRLPGGEMLRGTVAAVGEGRFTLRNETGESFTVTATPNTRIMRDRQPVKLADLKAGDGVGAGGVLDSGTRTLHAAFIFVIDAEQVRKAQADLGKTYILGRITAIKELKVTIRRPDGVSQVIGVDEGTSFRRGGRGGGLGAPARGGEGNQAATPTGESITLADLKVGDSVAARGALKNGMFVPTELHVLRGDRTRRDAGGTAPSAAAEATRP